MKPLELQVSGLHSYHEPVTIDFERLSRYGLFGIFGPIGSGKSSLLDGITLALYGLVDRVSGRSRRGIINLDADQVEVRLRFSIRETSEATSEARVYEVHRIYRATKAGVQRVTSRLVDVADGVVLADKERELNEAIEGLVGLCSEDFMRAVVLPQGRFMEVLHLRGSERRHMLQRIFKLHAYGGQLRQKLRARQAVAREQLAATEGELAGLGDASKGARRAAAAKADAAHLALKGHEDKVSVVRSEHGLISRRRERHGAWQESRVALRQLLEQQPRVDALASKVREASLAAPRVEPAKQWLTAASRLAEAERRAEATGCNLQVRAEAHSVAASAWQLASARASTELPGRRQRVAHLEEAQRWATERDVLSSRVGKLTAEVQGHRQRREAAAAKLAEAAAGLVGLDRQRRKVRRQLEKCRVKPAERSQVADATSAHRDVLAARERRDQTQQQVDALEPLVNEAQSVLQATQAEAAQARLRLVQAADEVARLAASPDLATDDTLAESRAVMSVCERLIAVSEQRARHVNGLEQQLEAARARRGAAAESLTLAKRHASQAKQRVAGADSALAVAQAQLAQATASQAASELAATLNPDAACPVCGSHEHPAPALPPSAPPQVAAVRAHERGRQVALQKQGDALAELGRAQEAMVRANHELEQLVDAHQRGAESLAELWSELPQVQGANEPILAARELQAALLLRESRSRLSHAALTQAREVHQEAAVAAERAAAPVAAAGAEQVQVVAQERKLAKALLAADHDAGAAWEAWNEAADGRLTFFDVPRATQGLHRRDEQAAELEQELERIEAHRADLQRSREEQQVYTAQRDKDLATTDERLQLARSQVVEIEAKLSERTQGHDVDLALQEARSELRSLTSEAEDSQQATARAAELLAAVTAEDAAAKAVLAAARVAADQAHHALAVAAPELPESSHEVSAVAKVWAESLIDEEQCRAWNEEVQAFRVDVARLRAREELLAADAGEGAVDDAAWQAIEEQLAASTQVLESAREVSIRAQREADEVGAKAERHDDLSAQRRSLKASLEALDHLASVLRGDRFVEFVANDLLGELAVHATEHLHSLTEGRYAIVLDGAGAFLVRDNDSGGAVRPVHTLSGGEAFLTSLALALALSTQVQARGPRPLEFFFLDEGFGTLDPEALDRVMTAIEALRDGHRVIGLISHVPGVRERVPSHVLVHPAGTKGKGSSVELKL